MFYYTRIRPWLVVLIFTLFYLAAILLANDADPKVYVTLGDCFIQCTGYDGSDCEEGTEGYDGQFAYYIARDPANAPDCLDAPAYRAQRILLPALGYVLSLGQNSLIPWVFVIVNLIALVGGTALLEDLLAAEKVNRWYALSYGLFAGLVMAVRLSTSEALAYGLVVAGIWAGERSRPWRAAILLGLAALAKETTVFFTAGYLLYFALHHRWRDAIHMALIVGIPFAAWQIALRVWLGEFGVGSGGALATPFEIVPFLGVLKIATEGNLVAFLVLGVLLVIPSTLVPALWSLRHTIRDLRLKKWDLYTCLLLANAAIIPFIPFSTYREPLGLLRFIPGLVLAFVLYTARHHYRRPLRYSTLWIMLLAFVVSG
jgi:hypothetical protein